MSNPKSWPIDPGECHDLLNRFSQQVDELRAALDEAAKLHQETLQERQQTIDELRQQLDRYRRYLFGPRRERVVEAAGQGHLFELDEGDELPPLPPEPPAPECRTPARPRRSRKPDYDRLPQVRIEHDVPEADKVCSHCGEAKTRIGEDESRVLQFIPARFELHVHVLPKYACSRCRDGVVAPPPPPRPLSGCIAGPGLVSHLLVSKFCEHLTVYRYEDISARYGLFLSRSTLCDWVSSAADLLTPLYQLEKELVLKAPVIWTDDTSVKVLGGENGSYTANFWVYIGPAQLPYDVYDFTVNRTRDGPAQFLANYAGYLQADAFSGYDRIYTGSEGRILEVACWAHARRKFFEARSSSPAEASLILEIIRRLYEVEDRARALDDAARAALRQADAVPVLERLRAELDRLSRQLLPKSALAQAVTYASNQWEALCRYTEDGRLTIDNNVSERRVRHQAIGRKNWLFLGGESAGPRAAVIYTIIAGAKRHRLEPWAYLHDVILQLAVDASPECLERLLPDRWAAAHPEHVLSHRLDESREKARRRDQRRASRPRLK